MDNYVSSTVLALEALEENDHGKALEGSIVPWIHFQEACNIVRRILTLPVQYDWNAKSDGTVHICMLWDFR